MSNICSNTLYAYSEDSNNINSINTWFNNNYDEFDTEVIDDNSVEYYFDSKWTFPLELMDELYASIPNKSDIYMRCLSVEYGCDYVAYHKCEENGWYPVV